MIEDLVFTNENFRIGIDKPSKEVEEDDAKTADPKPDQGDLQCFLLLFSSLPAHQDSSEFGDDIVLESQTE